MLQGKGQPSSGHREEKQDQVPASRPGHRDEKGSEPGGEFTREGLLKTQHPLTLSSHKPQKRTSSNGVVIMKVMV